ncbi:hypothetical protein B0H34DRAFT_718493 [Crassisporium funariophilum]|nr:hypothetical protein B0H34DRAFT_718493 [Crassisporium funariophilum]
MGGGAHPYKVDLYLLIWSFSVHVWAQIDDRCPSGAKSEKRLECSVRVRCDHLNRQYLYRLVPGYIGLSTIYWEAVQAEIGFCSLFFGWMKDLLS